jgi:hypothetical protein
VATGQSRRLVLELDARARRALARAARVRVTLAVSLLAPGGATAHAKRTLTLERASHATR